MYDLTFTLKRDDHRYKLRCAKALKEIMREYDSAEVRIRRDDYHALEEMVKPCFQEFSVKDFMKLDLIKEKKVRITVEVDGIFEKEEVLAKKVWNVMDGMKY